MDIKTGYMMWFHMYYMDAVNDSNGQPKLYPVYQLKISQEAYSDAAKKIINKLRTTLETMVDSPDLSDLSHSSDDDEKNIGNTLQSELSAGSCPTNTDVKVSVTSSTKEEESEKLPFEIKKKYW